MTPLCTIALDCVSRILFAATFNLFYYLKPSIQELNVLEALISVQIFKWVNLVVIVIQTNTEGGLSCNPSSTVFDLWVYERE